MTDSRFVNKVILGDEVLIDLTADTVTAAALLRGVTAHHQGGETLTGTCDYDADTSDATAAASDVLAGKTCYVQGAKITGNIAKQGSLTADISRKETVITVLPGYYSGGRIALSTAETDKIIAANIRYGITVLGVCGSYTGEEIVVQAKTVTPVFHQQTVTPEEGYDYLTAVTVNAIPVTEVPNAYGGDTLTVGG